MESSKHLKLDVEQENEATDMANCRLRHGLNTHCQLHVFQYLSPNDLLKLCKMDNYFEDVIMNWVIGCRQLKFALYYPDGNLEMFEAFGKSFRKLKVQGNAFNFIIENIEKYCSSNTLTELQVIVKAPLHEQKMDLPMNLFTNLQKLRLECQYNSELFVDQLEKIADNALNLKILQLRGNRIQGEWLRTKHMQNLCELWLHTTQNISIDDLTSFLREHPKLKVFSFAGNDDISTIGKSLSKYCSGLEKFYYEDLEENQNYIRAAQTDQTNRFDFLSTFPNLNSWTLSSFHAFPYFLLALASNNIKELIIRTNLNLYKNECKIKHSSSLQTMNVEIRGNGEDEAGEESEVLCNFIISILSQLKKNIPNITLISERKLINFDKILEQIPMVRSLSISNIGFKYLPVEMRKIVRAILKIRQDGKSNQHLLKLTVNKSQWRELKVYEGINSIVAMSIDFNPMFHSHSSWFY